MAEMPPQPEVAGVKNSQNFLDKAKNFITMGGDKDKWTKAIIVSVLVILFLGLASTAVWGVALAFWVRSIGDPNGNDPGKTGACFLKDEAFQITDAATVGNTDWILGKLKTYNIRKEKADDVVKKSVAKGINPALMMAIWSGEASFDPKNDDAAFGCGVYGGKNRFPGWEKQVDCALGPIQKTISSEDPYNNPKDQNRFTRLFYNYTGSMETSYKTLGFVADGSNARIVILKLLIPDQVTCVTASGGNLSPVDISNLASWYYNQGPDTARGGGYWGNKNGQCGGWPSGIIYNNSGCGITSMAMIARYYGKNIDPYQSGAEACATNRTLLLGPDQVRSLALKFGLTAHVTANDGGLSVDQIRSALSHGPLLAQGNPAFGSSGGHYVVIAGIEGDNFIINDPSASVGRGQSGRKVPFAGRGTIQRVYYFTK